MLIDGYVAEQMKNAMLNSEQEQVKIYDAYYNKGFEDGIKHKEKKISDAKEQIFKWLIKREKEGYGTTLGECVDKVFELVSGK